MKRDTATMRRVLQEEGECRVCGAVFGLHCHHIVNRSITQDDSEQNLVALCHACHRAVHDKSLDLGTFLSTEEQAHAVFLLGTIERARNHLFPSERRSDPTNLYGEAA